jgi:hypothetical protein
LPKKCKVCKKPQSEWKHQISSLQRVCSPKCAIAYVEAAKEAKEREEYRNAKKALKSRGDHLREAQATFNRYIRLRDKDLPCISCGKPPKKKNAGHYRSVGACPELRFDELNCHLQCEHCNSYKSGNAIDYRINLIKKIGIESVEWLEGPHEPKKYTIDDIEEIKKHYRQKCKELNDT